MQSDCILSVIPLDFMWPVQDPFLFCVYHNDQYPKGNGAFGPDAPLTGRAIGNDFTPMDGWRMYHGTTVPGFPAHPHRGFETVTIVEQGFVDHSDSHGQAGRYGNGDVQWMTAGRGLQHSEMFPLLNTEKDNPLLLFQIWLNLPQSKKFAQPHFKMLWNEDIPILTQNEEGRVLSSSRIIAGTLNGVSAPAPAPDSWAADPANNVVIATLCLRAKGSITLPAAGKGIFRSLYYCKGNGLLINGTPYSSGNCLVTEAEAELEISGDGEENRLLLLQGKPINEPVVQYGPFVMNTPAEIMQAYTDYQKDQFGGWPWPRTDNVHPAERGRFARHAAGQEEIRR